MPPLETILIFAAASALLTISPGPAMFYIMSRSLGQGAAAGAVSAGGALAGGLCHLIAAGAGLSAVFAYSPLLYATIKYLGALYLIYLGLRFFLPAAGSGPGQGAGQGTARPLAGPRRVFLQGIVVELLNPKTTLFFLSFLPQFIDPALGPALPQVLVLGAVYAAVSLPIDLMVAFGGGAVAAVLAGRLWLARLQRWLTGSLLVGLGLHLALGERR